MAESVKLVNSLFNELEHNFSEVINWRRHMHQNPELSFQETETAKFIADKLKAFGIDVKTSVGGNGVIGVLNGKNPGKTIALRADFDALPIQDEKDVPYKSLQNGVMHACGHDGHTAALLGTAQVLSKFRDELHGTIIFIFQHAEELPPGGAKAIVEENILEHVDAVFGAHLASHLPLGTVGVGAGYKMAAVDKFSITIQGKGGHGARPQHAIDSIVIGTNVVQSLQQIVSRRIDPLQSAVVTIGVFHAGEAFNVIADSVKIEGTVRTFDEKVRDQVEDEINAIVKGVTDGSHAEYNIDYLRGYPALFNHQKETDIVEELLTEVFDASSVVDMETTMAAEDFAYYLLEKPGTFFNVGSQTEDEATHYPHHHPKFDIDERALLNIEKSFVKIIANYLIDKKD